MRRLGVDVPVVERDAERVERHDGGERVGEVADELDLTALAEPVDAPAHDLGDPRPVLLHGRPREPGVDQLAVLQ